MNKFLITIFILCFSLQVQAFEELVLTTDGRISNIKIENNSILDIQTLATILNERNTLFIIPLKIGETTFSLVKDEQMYNFDIKVEEDETIISEIEGFETFSLDIQPQILDYQIDLPPVLRKKETINIDGAIIEIDSISEEVE